MVDRLHEFIDSVADQMRDTNQVWAVLAVAAVVILGAVWLYGRTTSGPVVVREAGSRAAVGPAVEATSTDTTIAVHVGGAVRRPGMVWLPAAARLNDAIRLAGGPVSGADLDGVNLAGKLTDGQQVVVPRKGQSAAGAGAGGQTPGVPAGQGLASGAPGVATGAGGSGAGGMIDINSATVAQFDGLPGVGPVIAQRIFDYRTQRGKFKRVEDLRQVEGIGPKKFEQMRSCVTCGP